MKSCILAPLGACALSVSIAFTAAAAPAKTTAPAARAAVRAPSGEASIEALEHRFAAAFRARDLSGVMSVYSPDVFVFDLVPPRQYVGAAAYRKDWVALFAQSKGPIKFDVQDLKVVVSGDMAYSHSIQPTVWTSIKGQPVAATVRVTDVYRKVGGAWKIVQEHVSVPVDLATGKPDMTSAP